jgi:hypothetical protein
MPIINTKTGLFFTGGVLLATLPSALLTPKATAFQPVATSPSPTATAEEIAQFPNVSDRQEPDAYVTPIGDTVTLRLVNTSPSVVSYMMPGSGEFATLEPEESMTVSGLDTPAQIGFRQLDGGLTYAEISEISEDSTVATIEFYHLDPATFYSNPDLTTRAIVINDMGGIYLD